MTIKDVATLKAETDSTIFTNGSGGITAASHNVMLKDYIDSMHPESRNLVEDAASDGEFYARKDGAWELIRPSDSGYSFGNWNYDDAGTTTPPVSQGIRFNNGNPTLATEMYVSVTDLTGLNQLIPLRDTIEVNDQFIIQKYGDGVCVKGIITSVADNTTYVTYGIDVLDSSGVLATNDVLSLVCRPVPQRAGFLASSTNSISINADSTNPSYLTGFVLDNGSNGFVVEDAATGSIKNTTGRTLATVEGTINFFPNKTGGTTTTLYLVSERSSDGITWTGNLDSLRVFDVTISSESFNTKLSFATDWLPDEQIRFRVYGSDTTVSFEPSSETILGQLFTGASAVWTLLEV